MADLKRNLIELVTNPEEAAQGAEIETKKYWTPPFIPMKVVYQAVDLVNEIDDFNAGKINMKESQAVEKLAEFVADVIYNKQFTREELEEGFHAPNAIRGLQEHIAFISQGRLSSETKEFQGRKN